MSIEDLFYHQELGKVDIDYLTTLYSNPAVQKHLRVMVLSDTIELLSLSSSGKTDRELALAHENIRGRLSTLSTLISIGSQESQTNVSKEN